MSIIRNNVLIVWDSFKSGDKEAFAYFYNLYVDELFRCGTKLCNNKELVKGTIHEVFIDLYLKRGNNKTNPENLKYYLILALKRSLIKKLKKNRKMVDEDAASFLIFEPEYSIEKTILDNEQEAETSQKVFRLLNNLPSKQKEVLYLRFNEALTYSEIASLLEISIESVRKQVYRALKSIRTSLTNDSFVFFSFSSKKGT